MYGKHMHQFPRLTYNWSAKPPMLSNFELEFKLDVQKSGASISPKAREYKCQMDLVWSCRPSRRRLRRATIEATPICVAFSTHKESTVLVSNENNERA